MNDFTKGELYEILALLGDDCEKFDIYNKIKSLIDNYCEHDPVGDWHLCVDKCSKCGAIVDE